MTLDQRLETVAWDLVNSSEAAALLGALPEAAAALTSSKAVQAWTVQVHAHRSFVACLVSSIHVSARHTSCSH